MKSPAHASDKRILERTGVYLMGNFPYLLKCKFGITDNKAARRSSVSKTTKGVAFTIFYVPLTYGHTREKFVHALYFWANAPFKKGSGRSEWFMNISPISWWLFCWWMPDAHFLLKALVLITPIVWLDAVLWQVAFLAFDFVLYAAILAGGVAVVWGVFNF